MFCFKEKHVEEVRQASTTSGKELEEKILQKLENAVLFREEQVEKIREKMREHVRKIVFSDHFILASYKYFDFISYLGKARKRSERKGKKPKSKQNHMQLNTSQFFSSFFLFNSNSIKFLGSFYTLLKFQNYQFRSN